MSGAVGREEARSSDMKRDAKSLGRFVVVGCIGFGIDGGILTALTHWAGWTPWHARIPSFLTAAFATWLLNRHFTFDARSVERTSVEAILYLAIQGGGAALNLVIFGACLAYFPGLRVIPIVPLAVGAVAGVLFNFSLSRYLLYSARPRAGLSF